MPLDTSITPERIAETERLIPAARPPHPDPPC